MYKELDPASSVPSGSPGLGYMNYHQALPPTLPFLVLTLHSPGLFLAALRLSSAGVPRVCAIF